LRRGVKGFFVTRIDQPESPPIRTVALCGNGYRADERRRLIVEVLAQHLVVVAVGESVRFHYLPIA
jgi:hypothetical protein